MEHAEWRDMARATAHVRSFWKFFHFVNQFPRPARKNGHQVLSSRFLSRVFVITISSHLKGLKCTSSLLVLNPLESDNYTSLLSILLSVTVKTQAGLKSDLIFLEISKVGQQVPNTCIVLECGSK
jgi:hypothetical protein